MRFEFRIRTWFEDTLAQKFKPTSETETLFTVANIIRYKKSMALQYSEVQHLPHSFVQRCSIGDKMPLITPNGSTLEDAFEKIAISADGTQTVNDVRINQLVGSYLLTIKLGILGYPCQ